MITCLGRPVRQVPVGDSCLSVSLAYSPPICCYTDANSSVEKCLGAIVLAPGLVKRLIVKQAKNPGKGGKFGKIMRRILRKIAEGDVKSVGDTSTLADPSVVDSLIQGRKAVLTSHERSG